jgi:cobalt/nickel transport system permease protein
MYLDRLEYKKDFLRFVDGRCRFVSAVALIIGAVYTTSIAALSVGIAACLILLCREPRVTAVRLLAVNAVTAAVWVSLVIGMEAGRALLYTLRINAAALLYMAFVIPMGAGAIAQSLLGLRVPDKLASLFVLTYRSLFLMGGRLSTALVSMRLRSPENGTFRQWRSFAAVFASVTAAAVFRSRRVSLAMMARGFDGALPRTRKYEWKPRDTAVLVLCASASLLAVAL